MFLRICSKNQLRQSISLMQFSLNNPCYNATHQFSRTGQLATIKRDFYSDLKVPRNAIQRDISKAYTEWLKLYQAELAAGVKDAADKLKRLNQAYYVLGNIERKRMYDKGLMSFSKNLPESLPVRADFKKNASIAELEPLPVTEKTYKDYLEKQLGDMHDKVLYKERIDAIEGATDIFLNGEPDDSKVITFGPPKGPDTYTERALRKLIQKGKFLKQK